MYNCGEVSIIEEGGGKNQPAKKMRGGTVNYIGFLRGGQRFSMGDAPLPPPLPAMKWRQCPDLCFTHPEQVQGVENQEGGVEDKSTQKCPQHHVRPAVQSQ